MNRPMAIKEIKFLILKFLDKEIFRPKWLH